MNLSKKKNLAARTLKVGKARIVFLDSRKDEIKEAITKQDIKDLQKEGAIIVKPVKGRKKNTKRKHKRGVGKVKKNIKDRKKNYVTMTRKLRKHISGLKTEGKISREDFIDIRKKIKNKKFSSLNNLKAQIKTLK